MVTEGQTGYCKICAHPQAGPRLIMAAQDKRTAKEAQAIAALYGLSFTRQTWYAHLQHSQSLVAQPAEGKAVAPPSKPFTSSDIKKSSNTQFLETIRDIGYTRAVEHPEEITIEQSLKAVSILEGRKDKSTDHLSILVQFVTGNAPAVVIEGEATEIPAHATDRRDEAEPAPVPALGPGEADA